MERNRLGSTREELARASLEAVIAFLESQVEDMNTQMLEAVQADPELRALDTLLRSVPGVEPVVSATLLSSLPELGGSSVLLETAGGMRQRFSYAETFAVPAAAETYRLVPEAGQEAWVIRAFVRPSGP